MTVQKRGIKKTEGEMRFALYILMLMPLQSFPQTLTEGSRVMITPAGEEKVILYAADGCDHCYYYLPSSLRISTKVEGTPEASFLTWKDDKTSRATGGILHFLVEWGLKPGYEKELQEMLRSRDSLGVIMGPVTVNAYDMGTVIAGDDKLSGILNACLKNTPSVPNTPGAKMALSFRFTEKEIEDFLYYLNHPGKAKTDLSIAYTYAVHTEQGQMRTGITTLRLSFRTILETLK